VVDLNGNQKVVKWRQGKEDRQYYAVARRDKEGRIYFYFEGWKKNLEGKRPALQ
jgi:hypothetical protein